jgi:acetyltransferase-like isoleucine patch superfamily enzyme
MGLSTVVRSVLADARQRLTGWILAQRVRQRFPTLACHPTAIWDYSYHDLDAIQLGAHVSVGPFVEIVVRKTSPRSSVPGRLSLGEGVFIGAGVNLRAAGGEVTIGSHTALAQHTVVVAANHHVRQGLRYLQATWEEARTGVAVGNNVWVSANCVLLPGCRIGDNAVIAAGSVVRGTVPPGEIWGGVPARKLKDVPAGPA